MSMDMGRTTQEINDLCRALARQDGRDVYLISKLTDLLGAVHILRNHQRGEGGVSDFDYA